MRKFVFELTLAGLIFCCLVLSGCDKEKAAVYLSPKPITVHSFKPEKVFEKSKKIHYVLYNPKGFESNVLRVQIIKVDDKVHLYGYSIAQARDIEINPKKNKVFGGFYLYNEGYYILRLFDHAYLKEPVAQTDFWVKERNYF